MGPRFFFQEMPPSPAKKPRQKLDYDSDEESDFTSKSQLSSPKVLSNDASEADSDSDQQAAVKKSPTDSRTVHSDSSTLSSDSSEEESVAPPANTGKRGVKKAASGGEDALSWALTDPDLYGLRRSGRQKPILTRESSMMELVCSLNFCALWCVSLVSEIPNENNEYRNFDSWNTAFV